MQRCTPATHLPGRAEYSAGPGRGTEGRATRKPLTWQKHLCAAVSGGCCPPWPERSRHTAPRRPIRKPQRRPIAALDARCRAPRLGEPKIREQAVCPQMKPARAGPRRRPTSGPPPRPALGSPATQGRPPPGGDCGRAKAPAPASRGLGPVSFVAREADERTRFPDPPARPPRAPPHVYCPKPRDKARLARPKTPRSGRVLPATRESETRRVSVVLQGPAPPRALRASPSVS